MNCGLLPLMQAASQRQRIEAQKLLHEHEMGESFKVMAVRPWHAGVPADGLCGG